MWIDDLSGRRLNEAELHDARVKARRAYRANTHIFEDEAEALIALGVVPVWDESAFGAGLAGIAAGSTKLVSSDFLFDDASPGVTADLQCLLDEGSNLAATPARPGLSGRVEHESAGEEDRGVPAAAGIGFAGGEQGCALVLAAAESELGEHDVDGKADALTVHGQPPRVRVE
jgi:hypothetical protein